MSNEFNRTDEEWQEHAEKKLWELIDGVEIVSEKVDKDGCVHELHTKQPPNMEAVKFALKNKSKGKWADKTEITNTQINVNLTASYDEINKMLAKQKEMKTLPVNDYIDADVIAVSEMETVEDDIDD